VIRYNLVCDKHHAFESWFQSSAAYDRQAKRGLVSCPLCGSAKVEKAIMAPRLARKDKSTSITVPEEIASAPATETPTQGSTHVAMISPQEREFRKKLKELRDHLTSQLRMTKANQRDRALITFLIESLDEDGYLTSSLEEVKADLPDELEVDVDELSAALALLQSFDPPGVGGRSASECLKLQLLRLDPSPIRTLALDIVMHHLELLAARDFTRLRKQLKASDDALRDAHLLIRSLEPFPGAAFGKSEADYVVPDILVRKMSGGWTAELNPEIVPRLRINHLYANILRNNRGDPGSGSLRQQLQEARWLIKNIQQRFETILRVAQAIVERQKNFFAHGEIAMRPLVLREIADTLGLHESTVSRVTTGKYMLTPFGTLEFKYFFGSHVSTDTGGAASSTAIRALIKQLIGAEDSKSPLSDSRIAELLAEQGFVVARRTVAKYREALKIPAVNLRKSL